MKRHMLAIAITNCMIAVADLIYMIVLLVRERQNNADEQKGA